MKVKSIQTKLRLAIMVVLLVATAVFLLLAVTMAKRLIDTYSNKMLLVSVERAGMELENAFATSPDNASVSPDEIRRIVTSAAIYEEGNAFLMDTDGSVIYSTKLSKGIKPEEMNDLQKDFFTRVQTIRRDVVNEDQKVMNGRTGKIVVTDLQNGMTLGMAIPLRVLRIPWVRMSFSMVFSAIIITIVAFVTGNAWLRSIIQPLSKMTDIADHYAAGDYSEKMPEGRNDEIGRLSNSLQTMSQTLVDQKEKAEAANKAKSAFLSNMSHEIRTPITAVLGFNEMILRESGDRNILNYAGNIKSSGHTLLGIINDILDFSKIEAGKLEIIPVDYDLSSLINDLVNMVNVRAGEKGLALTLDFDRNLPSVLHGDEIRLKQIVMNILTNAVKYTEKGGIVFSIGYEKNAADPASVILKVSVKDTGIGIREEDLKRLFTKFERLEEGRNRNIEGTGLGMNITQSLLEMMDSSLHVESTYGLGSVFSFSLKQEVVKWDPIGDYKNYYKATGETKEHYRSRFTAKGANVLVVDDNSTNLLVFKNLIKQTLIDVDTAASGDEGLMLCRKKKYDMIFLDHMMPEKDGIETLRELKAMSGSPNDATPVICLTANAISGARENYLREGFKDYLSKPIDPDRLEEMLMEYLPKEKEEKNLLDTQAGIKHCGEEEVYREVIKTFVDSMDNTKEILTGFLQSGDLNNYEIKIHSVKSNARMIGALPLGESAQKLEFAAKDRDAALVKTEHVLFMDELEQFRSILRAYLESTD